MIALRPAAAVLFLLVVPAGASVLRNGDWQFAPDGARIRSLRLRFAGARRAAPEAVAPLRERVYEFRSGPKASIRERTGYGMVRYRELWPGMDVEFYTRQGRPEYDIVARPGAAIERVALRFDGAQLRVGRSGELIIETRTETITSAPPVALAGCGAPPSVSYRLIDRDTAGFTVTGWERRCDLRIDPTLLLSGVVAGSYERAGESYQSDYYRVSSPYSRTGAVLATRDGAALLATSNNYPYRQPPAYLRRIGSGSSDTATFAWTDNITALAEDPQGGYYLAGSASTRSAALPVTPGAYRTAASGTSDGFLLHLNANFSTIDWATYLGFTPVAIAVDTARQIYLTGQAADTTVSTPGAYRTSTTAASSIGVLKLSADGRKAQYLAVLGGSAEDEVTSIAVDAQGGAVIGGLTLSKDLATAGAFQDYPQLEDLHLQHGFVARLSPDGTRLVAATCLGGRSYDEVRGVQVTPSGDVIAVGMTRSSDFPAPGRPLGPVGSERLQLHGFVVRLNPTLTAMPVGFLLNSAPLIQAAFAPDDHFVFAISWRAMAATPDAILGPTAAIHQYGMSLIEVDTVDGRVVHSSGFGRYPRNLPLIAAGANGVVAIAGSAGSSNYPVTAGLSPATGSEYDGYLPVAAQLFRFGDTAPAPASVTIQGLTRSAPAAFGSIQFPPLRRAVAVDRAAVSIPSWLAIEPDSSTSPAQWRWHALAAGLTPGRYTATQPIRTSGGTAQPDTVQFTMYVDELRPTPSELAATVTRGQTATMTLRVGALSGLPFALASDQPWIRPDVAAAVSPAEVTVQLSSADLEPGAYRGTVTLTPNGVTADAVKAAFTLTVI